MILLTPVLITTHFLFSQSLHIHTLWRNLQRGLIVGKIYFITFSLLKVELQCNYNIWLEGGKRHKYLYDEYLYDKCSWTLIVRKSANRLVLRTRHTDMLLPDLRPYGLLIDHFRITLQFPRTITWSRGFVTSFHTFAVFSRTKPRLQVIVRGNWSVIWMWSIDVCGTKALSKGDIKSHNPLWNSPREHEGTERDTEGVGCDMS